MKKFLLYFFLTALSTLSYGQSTKVWIFIVGISDYQYFNDLQYADDDALALRQALVNALGDRYQESQTKVLLNENATAAAIEMGMRWLLLNAKENDRVIIYFSGHGGFEDLTDFKLGYLHAYDAYSKTYSNGGNISLEFLQAFIQSLSRRNVNTLFIADACHSGKSDGGENLMFLNNSLANEIQNISKILSAQGNEKSFEDAAWGGGHGVFTYYLIRALMGFADTAPKDGLISLLEVERYLFDKVPVQTQYLQNPKVVSTRKDILLAPVNTEKLAEYEKIYEQEPNPDLMSVLLKGSKSDVLSLMTDSAKMIYQKFQEALAARKLVAPEGDNAFHYYKELVSHYPASPWQSLLEESLYIVSMNEAQNYVNQLLNVGEEQQGYPIERKEKILMALNELLSIIEPEDQLYTRVKVKAWFFEADISHTRYDLDKIKKKALQTSLPHLLSAIQMDSTAAYLYATAGEIYYHLNKKEEAIKYSLYASKLAPRWSNPYNNIGNIYWHKNDRQNARINYQKCVDLKPNYYNAYRNLVFTMLGAKIKNSDEVATADSAILLLEAGKRFLYSENEIERATHDQFRLHLKVYDYNKDKTRLRKAIDCLKPYEESPTNNYTLYLLGLAQTMLDPSDPEGYVTLSRNYASDGKTGKAIKKLKQAVSKRYSDFERYEKYPEVTKLVQEKSYKMLTTK